MLTTGDQAPGPWTRARNDRSPSSNCAAVRGSELAHASPNDDQPLTASSEVKQPCNERPGCDCVIRTTRTWFDVGVPACCGGEDFEVAT